MAQARKHHFVPASYLAQFTKTQSQDDVLWIFDGEQNRSWPGTPRGSGFINDYNAIDVPSVDPLYVENKVFGRIENVAAPAIRAWCGQANGTVTLGTQQRFHATADELSAVFSFIAAQAIRVPRRREALDRFHTDLVRNNLEASISSEELFASEQASNEHLREFSRQEVREIIDDPSLTVKSETVGYFQALLPAMVPIAATLEYRRWTILQAPSDAPDFICSDDPVVLIPAEGAHPFFGTGFATPGSTIYVPLSSRHALWGTDLELGRRCGLAVTVVVGSDDTVPTLNRLMIRNSRRFLYASSKDFSWILGDGAIGNFEDLRKRRAKSG